VGEACGEYLSGHAPAKLKQESMASASVAMMPQESPPISTVISPSQSGQHTPREHQHPPLALPPELVAEAFPHSGFSSTSNSTASSSVVTTPSAGTSTLVPAYPYNTSLAPFLSPSLGLGGATPDDSEVHTNLPSVQVDYLSHEWAEEVCFLFSIFRVYEAGAYYYTTKGYLDVLESHYKT